MTPTLTLPGRTGRAAWLLSLFALLCTLFAAEPALAASSDGTKSRTSQHQVTKKVSKKKSAKKRTVKKRTVKKRTTKRHVAKKRPVKRHVAKKRSTKKRVVAHKRSAAKQAAARRPLKLTSSVAYVIDQETHKVLVGKIS